MRTTFSLLAFCMFFCLELSAQTTIAVNSFENSGDTWSISSFSTPPCTNGSDRWDYSTSLSSIAPNHLSQFWGIQDLNGNCGGTGFEEINFGTVNVSGFSSVSISFDFYTIGLDGGDDIEYIVTLDGTSQPVVLLADGGNGGANNDNTRAWVTETIAVPAGTNTVSLTLRAKQNGGSDYLAFDNVRVEGTVAITNDTDSEIYDPTAQVTGALIDVSTITTVGTAMPVFSFDIEDMGSGDGQPTDVTNIRLVPAVSNTADWTDHIAGVVLNVGGVNIPVNTTTIDDNFINLNINSGNLVVGDGAISTAIVSIYLNTSNIQDNSVFSCMIPQTGHNTSADLGGSTFATSFLLGNIVSNNFTFNVESTELIFLTQPSNVNILTAMSPTVQVAAVDVNGNIDVDFDGAGFDLSLATTASFDASATTTATAINGVATFSNLVFSNFGTNYTLTATDLTTFLTTGTVVSANFDVLNVGGPCTELIISEYLEGASSNKYLEIYNPTMTTVDLSDYEVVLYANGSTTTTGVINLSGMLAPDATFVIGNTSQALFAASFLDMLSGSLNFNGNDAVALRKNGVDIDVFGVIGNGSTLYADKTYQRVSSVNRPTTTFNAGEWTVLTTVDGADLTQYVSDCMSTSIGFKVLTATVKENSVSYVIEVNTSALGAHSATIGVSGGTAPATDYSFTPATMNFATSLTNTFVVTINDNAILDGNRTVEFTLTSPTGGAVISNATFTLIIGDDDAQGLRVGDLVIVGFDNKVNGPEDRISIANLVELEPGVEFDIANMVYEAYAPAGVRTNEWYSCQANPTGSLASIRITYTGTTNLPAGSVICFTLPSGAGIGIPDFQVNGVTSTDFTSVYNGTVGSVNFSTSNPDAIFLMQGEWTAVTTGARNHHKFTGTVLGGIQDGGAWYDLAEDMSTKPGTAAARRSRIPEDIECLAIQGSSSPGDYASYYSGNRVGAHGTLLGRIVNYTMNWTIVPSSAADDLVNCGNNFTISGAVAQGIWTGSVDEDWFNCRNWENLQVPDSSINVLIDNSNASRNCEVRYSSPNAFKYNHIAQCNDLTVNNLDLVVEGQNDVAQAFGNFLLMPGTAKLDMNGTAVTDGHFYLHGNWTNDLNANAFDQGDGTVYFVGNSTQEIRTADNTEDFSKVVVNKVGGTLNLMSGEVMIEEDMNFISGIVQSTTTELLRFSVPATATNASVSSHVSGPVVKETSNASVTTFTYPTGKGGIYGPIGIETRKFVGEDFTAEYFSVGYGNYVHNTADISWVSPFEWWNLEDENTTLDENVKVTLHWGAHSGILSVADVRVGHFTDKGNGIMWEQEGATQTPVGTMTAGSVTSDWATSFSPFTFVSPIAQLLNVNLLSFTAEKQADKGILNWTVSNEEVGTFYTLERSVDGIHFEPLSDLIAGQLISDYTYEDSNPLEGNNYYRLQILHPNGNTTYSETRVLNFSRANQSITLYPSPTQGDLNIDFNEIRVNAFEIQVVDVLGRTVLRREFNAGMSLYPISVDVLPAGQYILQVRGEDNLLWNRQFIKL